MLLFRPTGLTELRLVADSGWRVWPPRLPDQPIFYPVLTRDYACKIARDWNSVDQFSGFVGFVTEFEIDNDYAGQFEIRTVAGRSHQELWVPSDELDEFNKHIVGHIRVVEAFPGPNFEDRIDPHTHLPEGMLPAPI